MTSWNHALEVARLDLLVERRARETVTVVLPFGLAGLIALPMAIGVDLPLISRIGPAAFWTIGLLFGMQIAWRYTVTDLGPMRDLFTLLGIAARARFWGRALASAILMLGFMITLGLATLVFFSPDVVLSGWLIPLLVFFSTGLALVATLAADLTTGLSGRSGLAALLVTPLALPLLVGAAQGVEALSRGRGILSWILMLTAANVVLALAGTLAARPLEEAAR